MRYTLALSALAICVGPVLAQEKKTDFAHDVSTDPQSQCAKCHTNGTYKGGLSFDTREDIVKAKAAVPGKAGASEIITRVTSKDPELRMPPGKADPLTEKEIAVLSKWIDDGLPWEPGFAFKPATYVAAAEAAKGRRCRPQRTAANTPSTASSTPTTARTR